LGDAILELVVSRVIFEKFPDKEEGYLTVLRSSIVNTQNLARVARELNLGQLIFLSKGEEKTGRGRVSLLADTLEAVIGAMYLDRGLDACEEFIDKFLLDDLEERSKRPLKSPKSILQELMQNRGLSSPIYKVVKTMGPDHAKYLEVEVLVNGKTMAKGVGSSKLRASENAATSALLLMGLK
jgi:ribonuclease-3